MRKEIIAVANYLRGHALVEQLVQGAAAGSDLRLGLFSGAAGTGKTFTARAVAKNYPRAVFVRAHRVWETVGSSRPLVLALLETIYGYSYGASLQSAYRLLIEELAEKRICLVIIDEADYLIRSVRTGRAPVLDVCRDIADHSGVPFLFLSVNDLASQLTNPSHFFETISSRLIGNVEFERLSLSDAIKLASLIEGVQLERKLISLLLRTSRGSIRPLLGLYGQLEAAAAKAGITGDVDLARVSKLKLLELPDGADEPGISAAEPLAEKLRVAS